MIERSPEFARDMALLAEVMGLEAQKKNPDMVHPSLVGWMKCLTLQEGGTLPMMMPERKAITNAVRSTLAKQAGKEA